MIENYNCCGLEFLGLEGASRCYAESKRKVVEVEDTDRGILWYVFCHSCDVRFDDVVSIKIGHLSSAFHPDFVLAIFSQIVKAGDIESEFTAFGKFSDVQTCGDHFFFRDVRGHICNTGIDIENSVFNETEDGLLLCVLDEVLESISDIFVEFGEEDFGFLVGEWSHQQSIYNKILIRDLYESVKFLTLRLVDLELSKRSKF